MLEWKLENSVFQAVSFFPLFSVFLSFFSKPLEVLSSGGDMWTRTSQKPCKILKNQKNDSSMEMP